MLFNVFLILTTLFFRIFGFNWGSGFFFHPDENNMAWAIGRLSTDSLDPQFFAYGQLPLYLVFFITKFISFFLGQGLSSSIDFKTAVYGLRIVSAIFSCLTVLVGYLLAKKIFADKKWARVFSLFLVFCPGLIQMAHFGTTESILAFVSLSLTFLSLRYLSGQRNIFLLAIVASIGMGSKVSSLIFFLVPILAIVFAQEKKSFFGPILTKLKALFSFSFLSLSLGLLLSPFLVLRFRESLSTLTYESKVASGIIKVFYTRQFFKTRPVIFQMVKVFPSIMGSSLYLLFIISIFLALMFFLLKRVKVKKQLVIISIAILPWFILNSFLFTKWVRFMSPILPLLLLLPVWGLKVISKIKILKGFLPALVLVCLFPGIVFIKLYLFPDIRVQASDWLKENVSDDSLVVSEAGNVVNIPMGEHNFEVVNFDFYSLDELGKRAELEALIEGGDYFLSGSRRIFANVLRLPNRLPVSFWFYRQLLAPNSDFELVKTFSGFNAFDQMFLGDDLNTEETWTVFDHPTIRVFKRK